MGEKSKLRRTISKWASSDEQHARELRATTQGRALRPDLPVRRPHPGAAPRHPEDRDPATRAAASRPSRPSCSTAPASLVLVWLGRREIAAITPGRPIEVEGRIGRHGPDRIIYNPRYQLLP